MESYIATINPIIENSNLYVKVNLEVLKKRGERIDDLTNNLLKDYNVAPYA